MVAGNGGITEEAGAKAAGGKEAPVLGAESVLAAIEVGGMSMLNGEWRWDAKKWERKKAPSKVHLLQYGHVVVLNSTRWHMGTKLA
jgi:hypothetical protein